MADRIKRHPVLGIPVSCDGLVLIPFGGMKPRKDGVTEKWTYGYPSKYGMLVRIKKKVVYVHRLVAETFVPNPDNLPCIRHLDGDRTNNHSYNLAWASRAEVARNSVSAKACVARLGYHAVDNMKQYQKDHYREEPRHSRQLEHSREQREHK